MTQHPFADDAQLLALLPLINKTVISSINLKEFGYTKSQFIIFFALSRCGNLTMSQVAGYISSSKEQATRAVAPLVDEGMVERFICPENRTKVYVRLTAKGSAFMDQWKMQFHQRLQSLIHDQITAQELAELEQAAEVMIRILSKLN